jgi:hypothetical protein
MELADAYQVRFESLRDLIEVYDREVSRSSPLTMTNETRVSDGTGVPAASPTARWRATTTAAAPWRRIATSSRSSCS